MGRECDHCVNPDGVEPFPELGEGVHLCQDCRLEALDRLLPGTPGDER